MKARPNFFIIGAPKCGTTALADWLQKHPEACVCIPKEPNFFHEDRGPFPASLEEYESTFGHARPEHKAIGDASPRVIYSDVAFSQIRAYRPDARYILMLRNPVEMSLSYHNQLIVNGEQKMRNFEAAWRSDHAIDKIFLGRKARSGPFLRTACSLADPVERTLRNVPRERLLIILLDDLRADPAGQLERVADFLGIARGHEALFERTNAATRIHSFRVQTVFKMLSRLKQRLGITVPLGVLPALARMNRSDGRGTSTMSPEMRDEVKAFFRSDVARLGALIGRDLSHWTM